MTLARRGGGDGAAAPDRWHPTHPPPHPHRQQTRIEARSKCYKACLKKYGWKPVCVRSPNYPNPTSHLPNAKWVMPNACTVGCQSTYAKYVEYFNLKTCGKGGLKGRGGGGESGARARLTLPLPRISPSHSQGRPRPLPQVRPGDRRLLL